MMLVVYVKDIDKKHEDVRGMSCHVKIARFAL